MERGGFLIEFSCNLSCEFHAALRVSWTKRLMDLSLELSPSEDHPNTTGHLRNHNIEY